MTFLERKQKNKTKTKIHFWPKTKKSRKWPTSPFSAPKTNFGRLLVWWLDLSDPDPLRFYDRSTPLIRPIRNRSVSNTAASFRKSDFALKSLSTAAQNINIFLVENRKSRKWPNRPFLAPKTKASFGRLLVWWLDLSDPDPLRFYDRSTPLPACRS